MFRKVLTNGLCATMPTTSTMRGQTGMVPKINDELAKIAAKSARKELSLLT